MGSNPHYQGDANAFIPDDITENNERQIKVLPRGLSVVWGNDNRYWKLPKSGDEPLELLQVCWLEVTGSVDVEPGKRYVVGFKLSLTPDAFGLDGGHLYVMAKRGKNEKTWRKVPLDSITNKKDFEITGKIVEPDSSLEASDTKIYFGLYEVWTGKWKGGLKIHHAFVREVEISRENKMKPAGEIRFHHNNLNRRGLMRNEWMRRIINGSY